MLSIVIIIIIRLLWRLSLLVMITTINIINITSIITSISISISIITSIVIIIIIRRYNRWLDINLHKFWLYISFNIARLTLCFRCCWYLIWICICICIPCWILCIIIMYILFNYFIIMTHLLLLLLLLLAIACIILYKLHTFFVCTFNFAFTYICICYRLFFVLWYFLKYLRLLLINNFQIPYINMLHFLRQLFLAASFSYMHMHIHTIHTIHTIYIIWLEYIGCYCCCWHALASEYLIKWFYSIIDIVIVIVVYCRHRHRHSYTYTIDSSPILVLWVTVLDRFRL